MKQSNFIFSLLLYFAVIAVSGFRPLYGQDMVVAKDGSGDYSTVQAAINAAPANSSSRTEIYIKNGTYYEVITVPSNKTNLTLIGESKAGTVLTYNNYSSKINPATGSAYGTSGSSSFFINGAGFFALNITFSNSSGPVGQAVAVRSTADKVIFKNCRFLGYQDTYYPHSGRAYHEDCYFEGTTDFIFGRAISFFENCQIYSKGGTSITAASTEAHVEYGYVFNNCQITGSGNGITDLGRPWRPNASVTFINTSMSGAIKAAGWNDWGNSSNQSTARFSEYNNSGSGYVPNSRVSWSNILSASQAQVYNMHNVLKANSSNPQVTDNWDPLTTINGTDTGNGFDPYSTMEAENYTAQSGIQTEACSEGGLNVGWIENGDWIRYNDVDFGAGANGFSARVASNATEGTITLRIDGMSGTPIGSCSVSSTGGWQSWTTASGSASGVSGVHDLYLMFSGGSGYLLNLNHFVFAEGSPSTTYTLASTVNGQGSISPSSGTYANGDVVSIVATPVSGWQFDGWGGDASGTSNPLSLTINANKSITANFSESSATNSLTIQENQTGFCSVDGTIDANNGGFTGDGFANTANASGEGIAWSVNAPSTGTYALIWKFANGDSTNRTAQAMINGSIQVANVDFDGTSSWTSWAETPSIHVTLAAGTNAVRLQATNASGLANIDYIAIAGNAPTAAACGEAALRSAVVVKAMAASNADFGLMLYPNPCNDRLTIELNEEMSEGVVIRLYDNVGRVIVRKQLNEAKSSLDISEFQPGIYFVNVSNAKRSVVKCVLKK